MTVPTVPVTVNIADFGGPAVDGVTVTAHPSGIDETVDGVFVSAKPVSAKTVGGIATLQCFPNALFPDGLGTKGTKTRFLAQIPSSRPLDVMAIIPNRACNLGDIDTMILPAPPPGYVTTTGAQTLSDKTLMNPADGIARLVDGATIDWDMDDGQIAFLTFTTQRPARKLNNPTHLKAGKYALAVKQHQAGGQNIDTFGSVYVLLGDVSINQAANSFTRLDMLSDGVQVLVSKQGGVGGAPAPTPAPTPAPPPPPAGPPVTAAFAAGTNLSGMEWAAPGIRFGTSTYPNRNYTVPRAATLAYLATQGITKVRLNIQWELLQPIRASSPANSTVVASYNTTLGTHVKGGLWEPYAQYIDKVLDACQTAGIKCLLDIHNYARYSDFKYQTDGSVLGLVDPSDPLLPSYTGDNTQVVGTIFAKVNPALTQADFTDLWTKMATRWKSHAALGGYGLMNEPHLMPAVGKNFGIDSYPNPNDPTNDYAEDYSILPVYAQAAVTAIRAVDGTTPIYVCGNGWSSCINYQALNPGFPLTGNNIVYELHVYPDATSGGFRFDWDDEVAKGFSAGETGGAVISTTSVRTRLAQAVAWGATHGNPVFAVTEFGIPVEAKPDGTPIDSRWITAAADALAYMKAQNMEVYTWMGGDHWTTRGYPINHVPKLHQGKTVNPIAGALLLGALGTNSAVVFDEGGNYSTGGAAVTRKLQARGNLTSSVTITVASDNGGTFSKTSLTLAAGVNSEDSFTFTPTANTKATLTYTRTGGGQAPPPCTVYAYTDPVTLAATNLPDAAKTILAKYNAACWLAKDALKEFMTPAAAAVGDYLRGIDNSGFGSTIESPMDALNWMNQDAGSLRGSEGPPLFNNDTNGIPAADFTVYGRRGLLCKKLAPVVAPAVDKDNYRFPAVKMPANLKDAHFMLACFSIATAGVDGTLLAAQEITGAQHSAIRVVGTSVRVEQTDLNGATAGVGLTVPAPNTTVTAALVSGGSTLRMRLNGTNSSTVSTTGLAASAFGSIGIGYGYWNYYPQQAIQGYEYGWILGAGNPIDTELAVLENYLKSFAQASVGGSSAETLIQAQFDSPNNNVGWWGDNRSLSDIYVGEIGSSGATTGASSWADLIGSWRNHGNLTNVHDMQVATAVDRPSLGTDAGGFHFGNEFSGHPIKSTGAATTALYAAVMVDLSAYAGTILSNMDVANHGFRIRYDGNTGRYYFAVGKGASTLEIFVSMPWAGTEFHSPGKHLVEVWYDGTNIGLRIDKSATLVTTSALGGSVTAGAADFWIASDPSGSNSAGGNYYTALVLPNFCFGSGNRDTVATFLAGRGGLTV